MEFTLSRHTFTKNSTIGDLSRADLPNTICKILEDCDRRLEKNPAAKQWGLTAIPRGRYQIVVTESNRFKRPLPLLIGVPGYEGVRIHPGNTPANTEGCLLPGMSAGIDCVLQSKVAFEMIFTMISRAIAAGDKVFITVR